MTQLLLSVTNHSRVATLLEEIQIGFDSENIENSFARVAWSGLGEPGDRAVGLLCSALGPVEALRLVISAVPPGDIAQLLPESDVHDLEELIGEALVRWAPRLNESEAIAHLERAQRIGARVLTPPAHGWESGLSDLGFHAPSALWLRGNPDLLASAARSVSLVGARASTGYGEHVTMELVTGLVDAGVSVVSGAAYGIDGMAHRAALASGGETLAVLAGGIDRLYPSGHDALLQRIIEDGLVITELPCGFAPTKWRFLQRNRLIAAISQATVVVEAGWRSGSLNTAHHALELNRPLGVVPGPVTSASSAGCHRLLRETPAVCVTSAAEVIELIGGQHAFVTELPEVQPIHPFAIRVLDALSAKKARTPTELATLTGLSQAETVAVLGLLEITGQVRELATGWRKESA
jgi:DNA processing protein